MRTLEEFNGEFGDELRGLLMESFAEARQSQATDHATKGKMMVDQMRRGKDMLRRMHEYLCGVPPVRVPAQSTGHHGNGTTVRK